MNQLKLSILIVSLLIFSNAGPLSAQDYLDTSLSPEKRARDLVNMLTLEEKVSQMRNSAPAIPRLNIPPYDWWNEALHGIGRSGAATVFPQAIGLGATSSVIRDGDADRKRTVKTLISPRFSVFHS
ncbi:MAG: hypothetical protein P8X57_10335 [Cyclobacteriaceae bacterium]